MRDIRKDLRERIEAIDFQRDHIEFRLSELDKKRTILETMLADEELAWKAKQPILLGFGDTSREVRLKSELSKFLLDVLRDGNPRNTSELKELALNKGIPFKGKSPLRAIHFTLVGMKNNNLVEMVESRVWKIHKNDTGVAGRANDLRASTPPTQPV